VARRNAEIAIKAVPGVDAAIVTLTADRAIGSVQTSHKHDHNHDHDHDHKHAAPPSARHSTATSSMNVRFMIAVASGKGGVGKSTTAANLALGLSAQGWRVGLLDADIYGPSAPRLFGLNKKPAVEAGKLIPLEAYGVKIMSMGFLVDEKTPMVWRGPMVTQALMQMLNEVKWGELDAMVIDMPPGTGDVQLTIAQQAALDQKLGRNDEIQQFQVANLEQDLASKLGRGDQIPQSQVTGLTQTIYELQNNPIPVPRVEGFDAAVQQIIDQQPTPDDEVIQGEHMW
jgi:ATP-binding protein involved in chromosome partitioning